MLEKLVSKLEGRESPWCWLCLDGALVRLELKLDVGGRTKKIWYVSIYLLRF